MKKVLLIIIIILIICTGYFFLNYKIETVCFGDVCPDNGGTYVFYREKLTEEECLAQGDYPVVGIGWSRVYAGCSPINYSK
ncbi:MAG: hypothetical protein CEO12_423 [Parcubacteria group bacterium Gr01-1014_46]|nr:MAG: hypothetical protein CEO12_423 [Parcubacteria group bacterium Gr01-1014_46]